MSDNLPEPVPTCRRHGAMTLRADPDKIAAWCGVWYDCHHPGCHDSSLYPSAELRARQTA